MKKYQQIVEYILDRHPLSRNDDRILYQYFLTYTYHKEFIKDCYIPIDVIAQSPNMDTLGRIRRKLQNEMGRYQALPDVKEKRLKREKEIKYG